MAPGGLAGAVLRRFKLGQRLAAEAMAFAGCSFLPGASPALLRVQLRNSALTVWYPATRPRPPKPALFCAQQDACVGCLERHDMRPAAWQRFTGVSVVLAAQNAERERAAQDWWNVGSPGEFWRAWNAPVNRWMKRTVYWPAMRAGWGKTGAVCACFALSAALHELVVAAPLRVRCTPYAALGMLAQVLPPPFLAYPLGACFGGKMLPLSPTPCKRQVLSSVTLQLPYSELACMFDPHVHTAPSTSPGLGVPCCNHRISPSSAPASLQVPLILVCDVLRKKKRPPAWLGNAVTLGSIAVGQAAAAVLYARALP